MSQHLSPSIRVPIDADNPAIWREESKCIRCGQCRDVCTRYESVLGTYELSKTNDRAICVHCGQCANVCPTGAISEVNEINAVRRAVMDPEKVVVVSTSPSVRAALGEAFGLPAGSFVAGKMVALLRALGANYVLDTNFAADLTIVEEASELVRRITTGNAPLPQFTSCCPAWVKFAETYYPFLRNNISTAKSPIGMQGPTVKTYFADKMKLDPKKIVNVAITPCTAKKFEIRREEMCDAGKKLGIDGLRDMDFVVTTRELARWAKDADIDFNALDDSAFDPLMGEASGAGVIFGNTGGVMEAALRTAYTYVTGQPAPAALFDFTPVRGLQGVREAAVQVGELTVNVAIVYGLSNVREFISHMGQKQYHFVEVMTCPGGCIGGGGQPKTGDYFENDVRQKRIDCLYTRDGAMQLRASHENAEVQALYHDFYDAPLSELAEQLLHTGYVDRSADLG